MLFVAPQPLSILSRGLSDGAGAQYTVSLHWMSVTPHPITAADTDLMQSLVRIDFTTVVAILLSFLAIVLGYDAICGERERGTLQLLLANSVPRSTVVLGKLIGGLLSIWIPLALAFPCTGWHFTAGLSAGGGRQLCAGTAFRTRNGRCRGAAASHGVAGAGSRDGTIRGGANDQSAVTGICLSVFC